MQSYIFEVKFRVVSKVRNHCTKKKNFKEARSCQFDDLLKIN